jgi:RHS repeat-associated protein
MGCQKLHINTFYPTLKVVKGGLYDQLERGVGAYRYGFNGMEADDEMKGEGNSYDFGARMLDPRIGRWLSRDAKADIYVPISPYAYAGNSPIQYMDPNGEEVIITITKGTDECNNIVYNITLTAKIYLTGSGVTEEFINELEKAKEAVFTDFEGMLPLTDDQGNTTWIAVNIKYDFEIIDASKEKNVLQTHGVPSAIVQDNLKTDENNSIPSSWGDNEQRYGIVGKAINVIRVFDDEIFRSTAFTRINYAQVAGGERGIPKYNALQKASVVLHEIGHLLGLADKYIDTRDANGNVISIPLPAFDKDLMGAGGANYFTDGKVEEFSVIHYINLINEFIPKFLKKKENTFEVTSKKEL